MSLVVVVVVVVVKAAAAGGVGVSVVVAGGMHLALVPQRSSNEAWLPCFPNVYSRNPNKKLS